MRIGTTRAIATFAGAALLLAGCGDELADFREKELRPLADQAAQQKARLGATLRTVEPGNRADARRLESRLAPLRQTTAELAELDPPDDYRETYDRFVAANDAFIARMREFVTALRRGDRAAMKVSGEKALDAVGAGQAAIAPLYE